ncbi:MAG: hypothetical protein Kow00121_63860 [Elainellaceae cyanobacterium]
MAELNEGLETQIDMVGLVTNFLFLDTSLPDLDQEQNCLFFEMEHLLKLCLMAIISIDIFEKIQIKIILSNPNFTDTKSCSMP